MFKLKKLTVYGNNESSVDFTNGLNIIYGPSECGKTFILDCIDYVMGSTNFENDGDIGINSMSLIVETENGNLTLFRKLDDVFVSITSDNPTIESGTYSTSKKAKDDSLNKVWLKILNLEDGIKIYSTEEMKTQSLSFRSLIHLFLVKENDVFCKSSALIPPKFTGITALKSSILYLLYHTNYDAQAGDDNKKKVLKTQGLEEFLQSQLGMLDGKQNKLNDLTTKTKEELEDNVNNNLLQISSLQDAVTEEIAESQKLANDICVLNEKIGECDSLQKKYKILKSQYSSDLKRMSFIVEGESKKVNLPDIRKCPFCGGDLKEEKKTSCVEAAKAELERLVPQINDLKDAEKELLKEINGLVVRRDEFVARRSSLASNINQNLKPKIQALQNSIAEMNQAIEFASEKALLENLQKQYSSQLDKIKEEIKNLTKFEPNDHFESSFETEFTAILDGMFKEANFDEYKDCKFLLSNLDVVVNGKPKSKYGKGYRAFINTLVTYALHEYLHAKNGTEIGTFIIDSPILSLRERDNEEDASDSMKSSLFRMFVEKQNEQIIIIENDIPPIDYKDTNIIHFTKDKDGRYGFINGVK